MRRKSSVKKAVLAYSDGLDTSVILPWLEENYGCEAITFTADVGQGERGARSVSGTTRTARIPAH